MIQHSANTYSTTDVVPSNTVDFSKINNVPGIWMGETKSLLKCMLTDHTYSRGVCSEAQETEASSNWNQGLEAQKKRERAGACYSWNEG